MVGSTNSTASSGTFRWEPPSVERLQELLPQYEITALIGRGGMGAVYKGLQSALGRSVAIKLLPESLQEDGGDAGYVERFKLEARSMANLDHPAIISVHDFGQTDEGHLYFVMEFIDGMDLQQYLQAFDGKLKMDSAIAIISHVLDALEYAHGKGIIHRDIKPANVLINSEGRVKIADFGLAKQLDSESAGLTMSNVAMGSPDFIAPEALLDSSSSDGRADLYAVGVMFYQMLTGQLPRGLFKLPSEEDASLDPRVDDIVAEAMEPNPEHRFRLAREFREKLDELHNEPVSRIEGRSSIERRGGTTGELKPVLTSPPPVAQEKELKRISQIWIWGAVLVLVAATLAWLALAPDESGSLADLGVVNVPQPLPNQIPEQPADTPKKEASGTETDPGSVWPTDPHYQSAGRFRAWSSIPYDPELNLAPLRGLTDVKQVHMKHNGWVVLTKNGDAIDSGDKKLPVPLERLFSGLGAQWSAVTTDGKYTNFPFDMGRRDSIPENLKPVKDAVPSFGFEAVLFTDGNLQVWGDGFDGMKEKGNFEWKEKPTLLPTEKGIEIARVTARLAILLSDGSVRVWDGVRGEKEVPREFSKTSLSAIAISKKQLFGLPASGADVLAWSLENRQVSSAPFGRGLEVIDLTGNHGVVLAVLKDGRLVADPYLDTLVDGMSDAIARVGPINPDVISVYVNDGEIPHGRFIWYDNPSRDLP